VPTVTQLDAREVRYENQISLENFGSDSESAAQRLAAYANEPLDVDCDLLEATNVAVNDFLDGQGVQFDNLGDLVATAIQDEEVFDQLSALILLFSGGEIDFTSASQAVSTNAMCGLIPQLIDNIRD
jgi:hypothetical protein